MPLDQPTLTAAVNTFIQADRDCDNAKAALQSSTDMHAQKVADREKARLALISAVGDNPASAEGQEA